ncbi:MAG: NAD(P)-dependent glycerol-3-phosphate dehydrogenase [Candidatus Delongbacteria bacterium]|nr:NAD(P)-dependent glycerol-3-phosphate dehydrogenase [Candidatus Delongbacteria bacterium]
MKKIAVIGGGSFGATLAIMLHEKGHQVRLWEYLEQEIAKYESGDLEVTVLPGVFLPPEMPVSNDLPSVVQDAEIILLAVPSHAVRTMAGRLNKFVDWEPLLVGVAKGIEEKTLLRMSQVVGEVFPALPRANYVCLSGPSHAEEVSRHIPTTVVASALQMEAASAIQEAFSNEYFRVYTNDDLCGVEVGGSVKNVIALAAGICDGLGFGDNTKGALLNRGLVEISRLGNRMGAHPDTFFGLSGMGDLITTCMSRHSRNRFVGEEIGKGLKLPQILETMQMVAEGVKTTRSVNDLRQRYAIDMPISQSVYRILFEELDPLQEVTDLMTRKLKQE